jgi:hypothetical protein
MSPFQSISDYENYVYTLKERYSSIQSSTLIVIRRGKCIATTQGELIFERGYRIVIKERLSFDSGQVNIESYGYEFWQNSEKIAWYDSQPHPDDINLESTNPHHKHILPDIKHHRIPSPEMQFDKPNLSVLIHEVEKLLKES